VDCTAFEIDFVDSGHLRISEWVTSTISFGPREMQVLDHRTRSDESAGEENSYSPFLGKYVNTRNGNVATVMVRDGGLAVEIPGAAIFPLEDPDEKGHWKSRIGHRIHFEFDIPEPGRAEEMRLIQLVPMERSGDPEEIPGDTPEELIPCLGGYRFVQTNAIFAVSWHDNGLFVHNPMEGRDVHIRPSDIEGLWIDEFGKNLLEFERGEDGGVTALVIHSRNRFIREE
jgi:hypothetical protein